MSACLVFIFTRQGTLGLFQWQADWRTIFILIGASALLPGVLFLIASLLARRGSGTIPSVVGWISACTAVVVAMAAIGLSAYILSTSRAIKSPLPSIHLVDPASGISGSDGVVRLSLSSDPHWNADTAHAEARTAILKSISSERPKRDAFFILGDIVERGMDEEPWREASADLARYLGDIPLRPIMGNHDAVIDGEYHYKQFFMPQGMKTDSGSPYYYSLQAGNATIIVLNLLWGAESFDRKQRAWFERSLAELPSGRQVIVLSHAFFYASGYISNGMPWYDHFGTIQEVSPILEKHGVDLVVSGHNHYMELLRKNGVTYAVIGAMGGKLDPEPTHISPASLWIAKNTFGRLDLEIDASGISMSFRDKDGTVLKTEFLPAKK
jgi:predicted MPP superfamily phosphohydrolase